MASAGDYAFEPPGETHTLVVPDDVQEMVTLFHVSGGYTEVDPYGAALGYEDVFTSSRMQSVISTPRGGAGLRAAVRAMRREAIDRASVESKANGLKKDLATMNSVKIAPTSYSSRSSPISALFCFTR